MYFVEYDGLPTSFSVNIYELSLIFKLFSMFIIFWTIVLNLIVAMLK